MHDTMICFADNEMTALWNSEFTGQFSDGLYENWNRYDCKRWWIEAKTDVEHAGMLQVASNEYRKITMTTKCPYSIDRMTTKLMNYDLTNRMCSFIKSSL